MNLSGVRSMRIRTIKPQFWCHPVIGRLDPFTRVLAAALLNYSDDEGFFLAEPCLIKGALFPFEKSSNKVKRGLEILEREGYIEIGISRENGPIGKVVNFLKHQKINRPTPSTLRPYFSMSPHRAINESSTLDSNGLELKGMESNGNGYKGNRIGKEGKEKISKGDVKEKDMSNKPPTYDEWMNLSASLRWDSEEAAAAYEGLSAIGWLNPDGSSAARNWKATASGFCIKSYQRRGAAQQIDSNAELESEGDDRPF